MRGVCAKILTAGLMVLAASPAFAQPPGPPGGGFGMMQAPNAAMLLRNDKVIEELKITDDQKADIKKAGEKVGEKYKDEFTGARGDRDKMGELFKSMNADMEKAVVAVLKPEQAKRLKQIEVQAASLDAFSRDDVQEALKLSDKQKKEIKETIADLQADIQDLRKDARGDRDKMTAVFKKEQELRAQDLDKTVKALSDDQKKAWKDLTGDKFEVVLGPGGFGPPGGGFGPPGGGPPGGFGGFPQPGTVLSSFMQDTLKLSSDQKKQLEDLQKDVDAKLEKILNDDQKKQLKDMKDRRPGGPGGPGGPRPPGGNPPNP